MRFLPHPAYAGFIGSTESATEQVMTNATEYDGRLKRAEWFASASG
jgi:hypothetical protein